MNLSAQMSGLPWNRNAQGGLYLPLLSKKSILCKRTGLSALREGNRGEGDRILL